ncbi:hypothetical protein QJS66_04760 [Kocuria rhizophila]|nr:hypothetical protein QJS66_04760 [Kocuria rhizophila]
MVDDGESEQHALRAPSPPASPSAAYTRSGALHPRSSIAVSTS